MTQDEQSGIWRLRTKWLGSYHIALIDDVWRAKRFHNVTVVLTGDSAEELDRRIQDDYATLSRAATS